MKLTIYGPGCAKCEKTVQVAQEAVAQTKVEATVEKITDLLEIAQAGVLITPALALDGEIITRGQVPEVNEVIAAITARLDKA